MQKSVIFVMKNFENKYVKNEKHQKVRGDGHYTGECRGAVHSI